MKPEWIKKGLLESQVLQNHQNERHFLHAVVTSPLTLVLPLHIRENLNFITHVESSLM